MRIEPPIHWHQGLFLQPQHLQLTDLHNESLLRPIQELGLPYFYGVADVQIQETGLLNKSLEILSGEFIFSDGTAAAYPGNAVIGPRSFDDAWLAAEKPFAVYLGLRKWDPAGENVSVVGSLEQAATANTRLAALANPDQVRDLYGTGPLAQVKPLILVLRIFWETELDKLDGYYLLPIAELERAGESIRLSRRFVPPCPTMAASDFLLQSLKDIRDQVTSRCRQLEEYKSPREAQSMGFDIGYVVFLLALRSLNRWVPLLFHLTEARHVHPWTVYGVLRQLIGELSTFSEGLTATGERPDGTRALPAYDHDHPYPCFMAAATLVSELLGAITVSPGHMIRLEFDGRYHTGEIPEQMFDTRNRFWLILRTEVDREVVAEAVRRVAKLSAQRNITTLIARAVPGVPLEYFPVPPAGLPRRTGSHYCRIDHSSAQWADVGVTHTVAFYWDSAPKDLVAEIVVLRS